MTTVNVQSPAGDVAGTVELPAALFDVEVNIPLVHQVVVAQLAAARQGTARHEEPRRGPWWWPQAVPPEGHRPGPSGLDPGAAVRRRWRRTRPDTARPTRSAPRRR